MQFTPVEDFFCKELKSQYCKGLSYTVRPADDPRIAGTDKRSVLTRKNRALLAQLVPQWLAEGKVVLGAPAATQPGSVEGRGDIRGGA
jgi:hypothetical protein